RDDRLARRDAAEDAAGVVRQELRAALLPHAHLVGVLFARERRRGKARADLDALDRIDAHQPRGDILVELAIDGRSEAGGPALPHDLDDGADGRASLPYLVEIVLPNMPMFRVGAEEWIFLNCLPVSVLAQSIVTDLYQRAAHDHARHDFAGDCAG